MIYALKVFELSIEFFEKCARENLYFQIELVWCI